MPHEGRMNKATDPVSAFESVREQFLRYVQTAFGTRFPDVEAEREQLLRTTDVFCKDPWIEPLPRYVRTGKTIRDLGADDVPGLSDAERADFEHLALAGLVGTYPLYRHQLEMLRAAMSGRN